MENYVALAKDLRPNRANAAPVVVPVRKLVQLLENNKRKAFNAAEFKPVKVTDKLQPKYALVEGDKLIRHMVYAVGATTEELMKKARPLGSGRSGRGYGVPKRFSLGWEVQPLSSYVLLDNSTSKEQTKNMKRKRQQDDNTSHVVQVQAVAEENMDKDIAGIKFGIKTRMANKKNDAPKDKIKPNDKEIPIIDGVEQNDLNPIDDQDLSSSKVDADENFKNQDKNDMDKERVEIKMRNDFHRKLRKRDNKMKQAVDGNEGRIEVVEVQDDVDKKRAELKNEGNDFQQKLRSKGGDKMKQAVDGNEGRIEMVEVQDDVDKKRAELKTEANDFQQKLRSKGGDKMKQAVDGNERKIEMVDLVEKQRDRGSSGNLVEHLNIDASEVQENYEDNCSAPVLKRYSQDIFGGSGISKQSKDYGELQKQLDQALVQLEMLRQTNGMLVERNYELKELNSNIVAQNKQLSDTVYSLANELKTQLDKHMSMQKLFHERLWMKNSSILPSPHEVHQETSNRSSSTSHEEVHQDTSKTSSSSSPVEVHQAKKTKVS